jgi:hypothetical protein
MGVGAKEASMESGWQGRRLDLCRASRAILPDGDLDAGDAPNLDGLVVGVDQPRVDVRRVEFGRHAGDAAGLGRQGDAAEDAFAGLYVCAGRPVGREVGNRDQEVAVAVGEDISQSLEWLERAYGGEQELVVNRRYLQQGRVVRRALRSR